MTRPQIAIGFALLVGAVVFLVVQHRAFSNLKTENDALQEISRQVDWLITENQRLSNALYTAS